MMGEIQRDGIDMAMHKDQVPKWPERCRKCLKANELDPDTTLYCDPDEDCVDWPFGRTTLNCGNFQRGGCLKNWVHCEPKTCNDWRQNGK